MGQDRPNGLAHLTINRDVTAVPEIVIDELSKKKRRLNFVLYLYPQILCKIKFCQWLPLISSVSHMYF